MHTVERSLVEHFRGRPFVIVGVNCDAERQTMLQGQARDHATWRSIHDDAASSNMERWHIERTPTVILIDTRGRIRYRSLDMPNENFLEEQIDLLLQDTPTTSKQNAGLHVAAVPRD